MLFDTRLLNLRPGRLNGVKVIGVDEHVWRHTRRGDNYVAVIIDPGGSFVARLRGPQLIRAAGVETFAGRWGADRGFALPSCFGDSRPFFLRLDIWTLPWL